LVQIPIEEAMPLGEDEYYVYQIVGLDVWTAEGEYLGRISEVLFTGANDVYVVQGEKGEILIPAIEDVVLEVDLDGGRLTVELMEGLI
jgi:16S rRNA processing protein RimM